MTCLGNSNPRQIDTFYGFCVGNGNYYEDSVEYGSEYEEDEFKWQYVTEFDEDKDDDTIANEELFNQWPGVEQSWKKL